MKSFTTFYEDAAERRAAAKTKDTAKRAAFAARVKAGADAEREKRQASAEREAMKREIKQELSTQKIYDKDFYADLHKLGRQDNAER